MGQKEEKVWFRERFSEELAGVDMNDPEIELIEKVPSPVSQFEKVLGDLNEEEKRMFVLWAQYSAGEVYALERGDSVGAKGCDLRAKMIRDALLARVAKRLKVKSSNFVEFGIREGWKVVGIDAEGKRRSEELQKFFSNNDELGFPKA